VCKNFFPLCIRRNLWHGGRLRDGTELNLNIPVRLGLAIVDATVAARTDGTTKSALDGHAMRTWQHRPRGDDRWAHSGCQKAGRGPSRPPEEPFPTAIELPDRGWIGRNRLPRPSGQRRDRQRGEASWWHQSLSYKHEAQASGCQRVTPVTLACASCLYDCAKILHGVARQGYAA
jgi:hypothetical protein